VHVMHYRKSRKPVQAALKVHQGIGSEIQCGIWWGQGKSLIPRRVDITISAIDPQLTPGDVRLEATN
jgi:hypothetical protein